MSHLQSYLTPQTVLVTLIGAVASYGALRSISSRLRSLPLPPGPPETGWLSGHLSILPTTKPWEVYAKWAEEFGPIVHMRVFGQHTVILSSLDDCVELCEKRSNSYSDRPKITMVDLMGWDFNTGLMPYGPRWRRLRRLFQQSFKKVTSLSYRPEQTRKVNDMLYNLLTNPTAFREHTQLVSAAIAMSIAYGYDVKPQHDDFVSLAEDSIAQLSLAVFPGAALVNSVPILRFLPPWFPGAGFHKIASESREMTRKMLEVPFKWVQENMEAGTQPRCVVSQYLSSCKAGEDLQPIKEFAALVYAAGADTTASALRTFFYAMTIFPDAQRKAQQELDAVVGGERLPNYEDWDSLPYTEALLREVLRWRPVAPLGVAHFSMGDDVLEGYLIPKGSVILTNLWAISRDKSRYTDSEAFNPDRFFDKDGNLNDDDIGYIFGFGRRTCPGRHTARASLWLSIATTLWSFNIAKTKDAAGNEISVHADYTDGFVSHPHPHACSITPRSPYTGRIIKEAVDLTRRRD